MKKLGVVIFLFMLAISPFVIAASHDDNESNGDDPPPPTNKVDKAYQCLEDLIDDKSQSDLSLQEAIFGTLALGSETKLKNAIEDKGGDECWPSSSCTIKDTAQVLLAYDRINKNTGDIETWLLDHSGTATELTWYLQIDITSHVESTCTLTYQENNYDITINEDLTIEQSSAGPCLSRSSSGFWLKVNNNCFEETFRTSCEDDFITSLLYQRAGSATIFVSPETHSSAALGTTEEEINSKCLKTSNACNYEGSLWAAVALDHMGNDASVFLPYLLALASENKRFFPNTFLYILTQGNDQYSEIIQAQQQAQYWQAPNTPYNRFYDTSLGMLALQGTSAAELTNSQNYLLNIQTPEGCWNNNNIRDTAFVLYAGWPTSVGGGSGVNGASAPESCEAVGNFCVPGTIACVEDAGGFVFGDLDCDFGICCSIPLIPLTCLEQNGIICSADQTCSGTVVGSLDGSCCLESCQQISQENECQIVGGGCFSSCTENEDQLSESCDDSTLVCCIEKGDVDGGGVSVWVWIIILVILIALVVLGIVYRRKLQLMFFNFKNRKRRGPPPGPPGRRPPHPPYGPSAMRRPMPPGMMRRPMPPQRAPPPRKTSQSKTDKELDETLKKLKEMSK